MNTLTALTLTVSAVTGPGWALSAHHAHRLSRRLHTDRLTGLANRDRLMREFRRAHRRSGTAVGVLLLDLDQFKQLNDAYGHDVGNLVLRRLALRLIVTRRAGELLVRLHGDEFAVLLTGLPVGPASYRAAHEAAARYAAGIAAAPLATTASDVELSVSASIGAAVSPAHDADLSALLRVADQRMYAAKPSRTEPARDAAVGRWSR